MGERHAGSVEVAGSIPVGSTIFDVKAKEDLDEVVEYKASYKDRVFKLDLENDEKNQTIYHSFNMNDEKKKHRKLSEREKNNKNLRVPHGRKGTEVKDG